MSHLSWPRRLPLSREGLFWLLIASAMLVTGLFKGINLITLLACWIIVLTGLNWWLARRQLRHLVAERRVPELIFAQTPFRWSLTLANHGPKAAHSVTVREEEVAQAWFVGRLQPGDQTRLDADAVLPRRGVHAEAAVRLTCGYPVGLAQLTRSVGGGEAVLAAPRLGRLQRGVFRHWLSQHCPGLGMVRAAPHRHPAAHTEFHGLRAFRPGDSPRHIHWRTTARRDELMVREFEDWPNDNLIVVVDAWTPLPAPAGADADFERLLSLAATLVWEWCRQKGDDLVLGIGGREPVRLDGVTGMPFAVRALRAWRVEGDPAADLAPLVGSLEEAALPGAAIVVLTLRAEPLAEMIHDRLHRPAGQINVAAGEDRDFFDGDV